MENKDCTENYSDESLLQKTKHFASRLGSGTVLKLMTLYYVLKDEKTPAWARTAVVGALGYFILPADAVPDILPAIGFTDDAAVIALAFATVGFHIRKRHKEQAAETVKKWFSKFGVEE